MHLNSKTRLVSPIKMSPFVDPFLVASFIFFYFLIRYYYNYLWIKSRLKTIPNVDHYPILGSFHKLADTDAINENLLTNFPRVYGKTYWMMAGSEPILFTSDFDLVEIVLSSQKHVEKPNVINVIRKIAGNGLVAAPQDIWRNHRKLLVPTFHYKVLEEFLKTFNKNSVKFVEDLLPQLNKESTEILSIAKLWSFTQATETILGLEVASNEKDNLTYLTNAQKLKEILFEKFSNPIHLIESLYYFTSNYSLEQVVKRKMNDYIEPIIKKKSEEVSNEVENKKVASLDLMVRAMNVEELSMKDVVDEVHTLLFASFDTIALAVSYTLYNFAEHPDMQQKAYEEVKDVLENEKEITMEMLNKMRYLEMFLKETMRVYTVGGLLPRKLGEDVKWAGLTLPKDLTVIIPIHVIHHDPETYPDPQETIPERFNQENMKNRHPYSYIPFSAGPRNCIGLRYAMLSLKTCLAKLLIAYKFVSVNHKLERVLEITIISKNGVKIGLQKRFNFGSI